MAVVIDWPAAIASWSGRDTRSLHLDGELVESQLRGEPLEAGEPVGGCACPICAAYLAGGDDEDAAITVSVVIRLAQRVPKDRLAHADAAVASWSEVGCTLPAPETLVGLAAKVRGAVRDPATAGKREPLPVEAARRADILETARRLGLGDAVRRGREWAVRCFMHEDSDPSLRLKPDEGLWYCDPCATGGDVIDLVLRVRRCGFADAVKELGI